MQRSRRALSFCLLYNALLASLANAQAVNPHFPHPETTNVTVAGNASPQSARIAEAFVSYSIEFGSFPDFAGTSLKLYADAPFYIRYGMGNIKMKLSQPQGNTRKKIRKSMDTFTRKV